jgi:hypothetical protein
MEGGIGYSWMTSEKEHTDPRSTGMSVFSMLAAPSAGFQSPDAGRANFSVESSSSPRRDGAMTRSHTGSDVASPSDVHSPKKREREEVEGKKTIRSLNMNAGQGVRGNKKGGVQECVSSRKVVPLINNDHQVLEFQTYCIINAGVNAGLGDEGMVRQRMFDKKMLTKFRENINTLGREYYSLMARDHPLQISKKGTWIMSEVEYVDLLSKQWGECDATPAWNELLQKYPDVKASGQDTEWTQRALAQLWYERDCLAAKAKKDKSDTKTKNDNHWKKHAPEDMHCLLHGADCDWGKNIEFHPKEWMSFVCMGPPAYIIGPYLESHVMASVPPYDKYGPFLQLLTQQSSAGPSPMGVKQEKHMDTSRVGMRKGTQGTEDGSVDAALVNFLNNVDKSADATVSITVDYNSAKEQHKQINLFVRDVIAFLDHNAEPASKMERKARIRTLKDKIAELSSSATWSDRAVADMHDIVEFV